MASRIKLEWVVGSNQIHWPDDPGIADRLTPECAVRGVKSLGWQ